MIESKLTAVKVEPGASSSSSSKKRGKKKGKSGKDKVKVTKNKWQGATADFGDETKVFALKNELEPERHVSYKMTVQAAEVFAAVKSFGASQGTVLRGIIEHSPSGHHRNHSFGA